MECRICSGPGNGFHYKITTCRACSAFFSRTVKLKLQYTCRKHGECQISTKNRFSCRYCRMKKCLDLGMTTEDLNTTATMQDPSVPSTSDLIDDKDFFTLETIFTKNDQFLRQLRLKMTKILGKKPTRKAETDLLEIYILQQADRAYNYHEEKWPISKETLNDDINFDMSSLIVLCYKDLPIVAELCNQIRPFSLLSTNQKNFYIKLLQLDQCYLGVRFLGTGREDQRRLTLEGRILDFHKSEFDLSAITDRTQEEIREHLLESEDRYDREFIQPFKLCNPDRFEFLYLMTTTMWDVKGTRGITAATEEIAKEVLSRCTDELDYYYKYVKKLANPAKRIYRLHNLLSALDRIAEIRKQDYQMTETFNMFKFDVYLETFSLDS